MKKGRDFHAASKKNHARHDATKKSQMSHAELIRGTKKMTMMGMTKTMNVKKKTMNVKKKTQEPGDRCDQRGAGPLVEDAALFWTPSPRASCELHPPRY